jgi:hypothetical protein
MTTITAPNLYEVTDAPVAAPYRYGLSSVVAWEPLATGGRVGGVTWVSQGCTDVGVTSNDCADPTPAALTSDNSCSVGYADVFTPYILADPSYAGKSDAVHEAKARDRFIIAEQYGVERNVVDKLVLALGAGAIDVSAQSALHGGDVFLSMLALVEQQLPDLTGAEGVIYMSRYSATMLSDHLVITGGILRTKLGTPVAAIGGWSNTPGAQPTGEVIYGTGPIKGQRGEVELLNGSGASPTNDTSIIVQRTYSFGYDCGVIGAEVTF